MLSPEARLVKIETELHGLSERMDEVLELLNSGPRVPWEQSIRGKLHAMRNSVDTADKLAQAAREVRRSQRHQWSVLERTALFLIGLAAAAAPYVVLFTH